MTYQEPIDAIKKHVDLLKDPSAWDYLIYLEITPSGQLINDLFPAAGHQALHIKISLLQAAMSTKALLVQIPDDELMATVELLHHISMRQTLINLELEAPVKGFDHAVKLFGINPIFGDNDGQPILEQLGISGTLFIKNIHHLDLETQRYLAELVRYGFYRIFKSDHKIMSNVRIICSTTVPLAPLVHEGRFAQELFNELRATSIVIPTLPAPISEISDVRELKDAAAQIAARLEAPRFHPAYQKEVSNPELLRAAQMGKRALKDRHIMTLLWETFKNQNKIATFLGVNRSSVSRRCRDFELI
jgi:DNA-binding NtrC family response regulator